MTWPTNESHRHNFKFSGRHIEKRGGGERKVRLALIIFYLKQYTSKIVIKIEKITNRIFNIHFFSSMSSKSNMYLHLEQIWVQLHVKYWFQMLHVFGGYIIK